LPNLDQLRRSAREIFDAALASVDPRQAVTQAIVRDGSTVEVCGERFDASSTQIFSIAIGKAAASMALGVEDTLGDLLTRGVISAPGSSVPLAPQWEIFAGGHPLPNEESFEAAEDVALRSARLLTKPPSSALEVLALTPPTFSPAAIPTPCSNNSAI
jgi:glycerate-2-kinase